MTTAYTSLLGLALPVTGELSGTWGDTVNTAITSLLDTAVAGTTSITVDADITLTTTTGASNQARQAIILWNPASGTTTRNITAPAQSKIYTVINASGGTQSIVIRGAGPTTGVTIVKGESATVAWNGSDFVKVGSSGGAITFTDLTVTGNTILGDAAADTLTVNATSTFASPVNFQGQVRLPSTGRSAAAALTTTNPAFLYGVASTYTDTTSSGTVAFAPFYGLAQPTLSTSNVTTYTNAATLYIAAAPAAGGSATITNPYALYVAAGANYFGGALTVVGATTLNGNVTLGDAAADNIAVNGTVTSNLIFTDNTYDIGASGATRPRTGYFGTSVIAPSLSAYTTASSNTGPTSGGVSINAGGVNVGFFSAPLTWDIGGGGGNVRLYTSRLGGNGGRFYIDTMATNATYYNRQLVTETGEWYWYNNNVTTGAQAMSLTNSNLSVTGGISTTNGAITANGVLETYLTNGLTGSANNAANNGIYWQVRPYAGKSGYLTFTENAVADRWALGIQPGDGTLYFRAGQVTGTSVAQLSSGGKLSLATATIYGNSNLTVPWVNTSSSSIALFNINALTADPNRGAFGDMVFKSASSFANNAAQAMIYLAARNYGSAPGTANDVTQGVGLWIRGYYDNSGAAVPIYLGGYSYNSTQYAMMIDQSNRVGIGVDPAYQLDIGNGTSVTSRVRLQRGSDDVNQFMTLGWSSISVHRASVPLSSPQTELTFNQVGSDGTRTPLCIASNSFVGVGTTGPVSQTEVLFNASSGRNGLTVTNSNPDATPAYVALKGYDWVRGAIWHNRVAGHPMQFAINPNTSDLSVNGCAVVAGFNSSGVFYTNSDAIVGSFNGRVVAGTNASINSGGFPGSSTYDTGISVNQFSAGGTLLVLLSVNTSDGFNTASGVYMIQFAFNGNNTPNVTFIAGSNSWTFGKSGSNTLTVNGPAGNNSIAWFGNK